MHSLSFERSYEPIDILLSRSDVYVLVIKESLYNQEVNLFSGKTDFYPDIVSVDLKVSYLKLISINDVIV